MRNSDSYYEHVRRFEAKREAILDAFEETIENLQRYQGSRFFEDEVQKAKDAREAALGALKDEYGRIFDETLEAMAAASGGRKAKALTSEQLRILQTLQMRGDGLTATEIEEAARAMGSNWTAIQVLSDLARRAGLRGAQRFYCGPLSVENTEDVLASLRRGTADLLEHYSGGRAARLAAEYRARIYGNPIDTKLPRRKPIETKEACFQRLAGLNPASLNAFYGAVDGEEDDHDAE